MENNTITNVEVILQELPYDVKIKVEKGVPTTYIASMCKPGPIANTKLWRVYSEESLLDSLLQLLNSYRTTL